MRVQEAGLQHAAKNHQVFSKASNMPMTKSSLVSAKPESCCGLFGVLSWVINKISCGCLCAVDEPVSQVASLKQLKNEFEGALDKFNALKGDESMQAIAAMEREWPEFYASLPDVVQRRFEEEYCAARGRHKGFRPEVFVRDNIDSKDAKTRFKSFCVRLQPVGSYNPLREIPVIFEWVIETCAEQIAELEKNPAAPA